MLGCLFAFLLFWPQFYFGDIVGPGGSHRGFIDPSTVLRWENEDDPLLRYSLFCHLDADFSLEPLP